MKSTRSCVVISLTLFLSNCATSKVGTLADRSPAETHLEWTLLGKVDFFPKDLFLNNENKFGPWIKRLVFSPDGDHIAFDGIGDELRVYQLSNRKLYASPGSLGDSGFPKNGVAFDFFNAGAVLRLLVHGSSKKTGGLLADWNFGSDKYNAFISSKLILELTKKLGVLSIFHHADDLIVSPDGDQFLTINSKGTPNPGAILWDTSSLVPKKLILQGVNVGKFNAAAFMPFEKFVVFGDDRFTRLNTETGVIGKPLLTPLSPAQSSEIADEVLIGGKGETSCLVAAYGFSSPQQSTSSPRIDVYNLHTGSRLQHFEFKGFVWEMGKNMSLDANCSTLLVGSRDRAKLMHLDSGKEIAEFSEPLSQVPFEASEKLLSAVAISRDGRRIALGYRQVVIFEKTDAGGWK